ncbi:MAG: TIGR01212 family radical SAM protein [Oscillospiraceae bacterium]|nr:TIGR01212 family radical SAM protein [Oscillospiraceae bacterium]
MEIRRISEVLKEQYGEKIYRISLTSGCTCPNRDGAVGTGGCVFCSGSGSGDFAPPFLPVRDQIREGKKRIEGKTKAEKFIGYFQSFTNTYGDQERLKQLFEETIRQPEIAILSVATRPDCLEQDMVEYLSRLNRVKPVWVELGLQTVNEEVAQRMNRCYALPVFEDAYRRLKEAGLTVIVHVIFGLPGETREDMLRTVRYLAGLEPVLDGIKLQMLHILKGTKLAEMYQKEPFKVLSMEEYTEIVVEAMKLLPKETVVHRFTGDGPKKLLIEPQWSWDKKKVLNYMNRMIKEA